MAKEEKKNIPVRSVEKLHHFPSFVPDSREKISQV
jgi:hypothetical protein